MTATGRSAEELDGLVNLRDLGGLGTENGHRTRPGLLYRSDAPHEGDQPPEGVPAWPPAAVVDLRDAREQEEGRHPLDGPETAVHRVPLLEELERSEPANPEIPELPVLYEGMLLRSPDKLVEVFDITVRTDGPVLLHCSAGKDRTGVAAALLLRVAGVRRDAIVADYLRTDQNMPLVLRRIERLAPVIPPGVDREKVAGLLAAPAEAIESVLRVLDDHDGGVAGWLAAHGAERADVWRWRERFVS